MQLSKEAIKEFGKIYSLTFGKEIDEKTALEKAGRLLELIKVIYKNYEQGKQNE